MHSSGRFCLVSLFMLLSCMLNRITAQSRTADSPLTKEEEYAYSKIYLEENWGGLKPIIVGNHWAFIDANEKVVVPAIYDAIKRPMYYGGPLATRIIVRKEKKWGMINIQGEQVLPFIYEDVDFFYNGMPNASPTQALVKQKGKWGVAGGIRDFLIPLAYDSVGLWPVYNGLVTITKNGKFGYFDIYSKKEAFPPVYDVLGMPSNQILKVGKNNKVGLMSIEGREIIPMQYEDVEPDLMGSTTKAKLNGKWGVVDTSGKVVYPFKYDYILYYILNDPGTARVQLNGKWGEVDKEGKEIIPLIYDQIYQRQILCCYAVRIGDKLGVIDHKGKELVPVKYEDLARAWDGALWPVPPPTKAMLNGKWGFLDSTGREVTGFIYEEMDHYYAPAIAVKNNGKWGLINRSGKEITVLKYDLLNLHYPVGYIGLRDGKFGMINFEGKEITEFKYDQVKALADYGVTDTLAVLHNSLWGFINATGKEVIAPKYAFDEIMPFREGLAAVSKDGAWGYIDKNGKIVVPVKYDGVTGYFRDGQTGVRMGEYWGLIDKTGKIVSPLESDHDPMEEDYDY